MADARMTEALRALRIQNLVVGIHDQSFPSLPHEDLGRGSPYSAGAARLLETLAGLGVNGIQLGPQGQTSESNPSPYDGTVFSRSTLSLDLPSLLAAPGDAARWGGLLSSRTWESLLSGSHAGKADRVAYRHVFGSMRAAVREAQQMLHARRTAGDAEAVALFGRLNDFTRTEAGWLERDALYAALTAEHAGAHWSAWPELDRHLWDPPPGQEKAALARRAEVAAARAAELERYALGQLLVHSQHTALRERMGRLGLKLYGDLQVGLSSQDCWSYRGLFLRDYLLGAPPSRTNPEGQAWSYPVLDPALFVEADGKTRGPAMRLVAARMGKLLSEFDGIRIDHPHGLVCPWVYRAGGPDPLLAVQSGARLFCSPGLPDHPALARFAIPRQNQLNPRAGVARYADDWVASLSPAQVERYSLQLDGVVEAMQRNGRDPKDLVCEVLSTLPYPLARVLERHGLGRFRVTQKADLTNPRDVYRSENAEPADWMMVGNHDTAPIWKLAEGWVRTGASRDQAAYLAQRLAPEKERATFAAQLAGDVGRLATAKLADLFASRAQNVMVFFADWFGLTETYNTPGTVGPENWSLRLTSSWSEEYGARLAQGRALNLPAVLAMALRAPGAVEGETPRGLIEALDMLARASGSLRKAMP